ncbi:MAG: SDR family NAD(P)-dependent oxidoreductase [Spirochaetes bacterium]|nr:SDR family NAD(P)-dependent oxidoreductase [Spirochaetota bacterium]
MTGAEQAARRGGDAEGSFSSLAGRRALVVGGSGGIGSALSAALARRGASVLVHGRSEAKIGDLLASIRASGGSAEGFAADIQTPASFVEALSPFGSFDVVAIAFGPFVRKTLASTSPADWERLALLDLALPGALACHFLPSMLERGFGRFLFFGGSRTDTIRAYRSNAAYAAAKTGLGVLVKSIAAEGAERDVAAILVCPGVVDTEYLDKVARIEAVAMAPKGLLLDPEDLASAALDLLEGEPCIASGAIVSLDAGFNP